VVVYVLGDWRVVLRPVNAEIRWEIYHDLSLVGRGRSLPFEAYEVVNGRLAQLGGPALEDMTES
jgi:hypothetical protein